MQRGQIIDSNPSLSSSSTNHPYAFPESDTRDSDFCCVLALILSVWDHTQQLAGSWITQASTLMFHEDPPCAAMFS
jgi:hypothetical protein